MGSNLHCGLLQWVEVHFPTIPRYAFAMRFRGEALGQVEAIEVGVAAFPKPPRPLDPLGAVLPFPVIVVDVSSSEAISIDVLQRITYSIRDTIIAKT